MMKQHDQPLMATTDQDSDQRAGDSAAWFNPAARLMVEIRGLTKRFGDTVAVDRADLDIYQGELFSILGASGSGKSTLLRLLAGFERPSEGTIRIDGVDMAGVPPYARPVNIMFQSYALFPHMTVEQNIAYGLKKERVSGTETRQRVGDILETVKMGHLAKRKPQALSGGESQRVALARALVKRPKLLLLDEPLAALDKKLREHTQFELINLQEELGITFVVVTHDQEEAMALSTRIAVMNHGRFEQVGTPGEVYEYPKNRFIADFIGKANLFQAKVTGVEDGIVTLFCEEVGAELEVCAPERQTPAPGKRVWIAVRPEKIFISKKPPPEDHSGRGRTVFRGTVEGLAYFGNLSLYRVELASGKILQVSGQNRVRTAHKSVEWDDHVFVSWDISSAILLEA